MTGVGFLILFSLSCMLFPCEGQGQIKLPPGGNTLVFLSGSNAKIEWSLGSSVPTTGILRSWSFTSSGGGKAEALVDISRSDKIDILTSLYEVDIETPATLVLKNVNGSYNGTYEFTLIASSTTTSKVFVFIAVAPNVTFNCSSTTTLNEGDDFTCVCRGEGGNPPADVAWDKDGVQIETGIEVATLTLDNVDKTDNGTYTCVAQSHISAKDVKSIEIIVNFKPSKTAITFTPGKAVVGESVTIMCASDGFPEPSYNITHNGTEVSNKTTYTISEVKWSDAGTYECVATNKRGSDSDSAILTVIGQRPPTTPTAQSTQSTSKPSGNSTITTKVPTKDDGIGAGAIAGIVIGVLILVVIVVVVVYCFCCKSGEKLIWKRICSSEMEDENGASAEVVPRGGRVAENHYELNENEKMAGENAYDTVNASGSGGASGSKSKPTQETPPVVYAQVDKENRQGKPLYATLDAVALESGSSKKRDERRPPPSEYASIDHGRVAEVPRADLV